MGYDSNSTSAKFKITVNVEFAEKYKKSQTLNVQLPKVVYLFIYLFYLCCFKVGHHCRHRIEFADF